MADKLAKAALTKKDVVAISLDEGLPPEYALNVWQQESGSKPTSRRSVDGARGPFQVMPATFKSVYADGDINDPFDNARGGIRYLKQAYDRYQGDPTKVYAAYHSGSAGFYTRSKKLKADGNGKTTLSYVGDAIKRHHAIAAETAKMLTKEVDGTDNEAPSPDDSSGELGGRDAFELGIMTDAGTLNPAEAIERTKPKIHAYSKKIEPEINAIYAPDYGPYGSGKMSEIDRQLFKLIDEV